MTQVLAEILDRYERMPAAGKAEFAEHIAKSTAGLKWVPNPGPQTEAYLSKADVLLFGGEPGGGKLLNVNTLLPTPFGWTTMGEVLVGDQVIDCRGDPCNVIFKSAVQHEPTFRLRFSDGSEIVAGVDHQWITSTRAERMRELKCNESWRARRRATRKKRGTGKKPGLAARNSAARHPLDLPTRGIRTTGEIAATLRRGDGGLNHAIDVAGPLKLPAADLLIDPYVLGAWLGDGSKSSGQITGIDEGIFQQIAGAGYAVSQHAVPKSRGILGLSRQLRQLGVLGNKHIPPAYLRASLDQRLALLQGLMDTDGYCDKRGQCEITLTRKVLIDGVLELVHSLGIKAQLREGAATLNRRVIGQKWRIKFQTDLPAFRLPRKLLRQKRGAFRGTHDVRYIVSCEPVDRVPLQCIQVDSPSRTYLCGKAMIPTHNTQLLLGTAFNTSERALIVRRQYTDLDFIIEEAIKINGTREGYSGKPPPSLVHASGRIDFAAAARVGDEQRQMGRPHDFFGADEATQFVQSQIRFFRGWLRTAKPGQRCRTILATNPPLTADGAWVVKMFAPWLDPVFADPAKPGELRWVVVDDQDKDYWVDGPGTYDLGGGVMREAESRTYIPSKLTDNPAYDAKEYQKRLDAMPAEVREILLGGFRTSFRDHPMQVIPTAWIQAAFARHRDGRPPGIPMTAIGVDPSGGGTDELAIAPRYDWWFAPFVTVPGHALDKLKLGREQAAYIVANRRDGAKIGLDMGGGYGGGIYECLVDNVEERAIVGLKGAERSVARTRDGKMGFFNQRAERYWKLREALDPDQDGGSPVALPEDLELLADLTALTYEVTPRGYKVTPKDSSSEDSDCVRSRLGRSPNKGDAVVNAWAVGDRLVPKGQKYSRQSHGVTPGVNLGPRHRPRRR